MKRFLVATLAVGILIPGGGSAEAATFIDNFDTGATQILLPDFSKFPPDPPPQSSPPIDPVVGSNLTTGILEKDTLGGTRFLAATLTQNTTSFPAALSVGAGIGNFIVSTASQANGSAFLEWDRNGNGLNADFSNYDRFELALVSVNTGVTLTVAMSDDINDPDKSSAQVSFPPSTANETQRLSFGSFSGISSINLENIQVVTLSVEGPPGYSVTINSLSVATPEPNSTLSLLAFGTLGIASTLKCKQKPSKSTDKETTEFS